MIDDTSTDRRYNQIRAIVSGRFLRGFRARRFLPPQFHISQKQKRRHFITICRSLFDWQIDLGTVSFLYSYYVNCYLIITVFRAVGSARCCDALCVVFCFFLDVLLCNVLNRWIACSWKNIWVIVFFCYVNFPAFHSNYYRSDLISFCRRVKVFRCLCPLPLGYFHNVVSIQKR